MWYGYLHCGMCLSLHWFTPPSLPAHPPVHSLAAEECELVLKTLLDRGVMNAVHLGRMAESDGMGLRGDYSQPDVLMGPASALFWRTVCEWLQSQATSRGLSAANKVGAAANIDAAAAGERLEALEAALPATVADMADIIAKHASAGAQYRFSTGQLMQLSAKCMDFADAAGRSSASLMLRQLLSEAPSGADPEEAAAWEAAWHSDSWLRALALFLRKVYGSPAELADAMLDIVGSLHRTAGFAAEGVEVAEQAWVHALSVAGLLLEQLTSARPVLAAASPFTLRDLLDCVIQPGLRHRSAKVGGWQLAPADSSSVELSCCWFFVYCSTGWAGRPSLNEWQALEHHHVYVPLVSPCNLACPPAGAARSGTLPGPVLLPGRHPHRPRQPPGGAAPGGAHPWGGLCRQGSGRAGE